MQVTRLSRERWQLTLTRDDLACLVHLARSRVAPIPKEAMYEPEEMLARSDQTRINRLALQLRQAERLRRKRSQVQRPG